MATRKGVNSTFVLTSGMNSDSVQGLTRADGPVQVQQQQAGEQHMKQTHTRRHKTIWQTAQEGAGAAYKQEQQEAGTVAGWRPGEEIDEGGGKHREAEVMRQRRWVHK